MNLKKPTVTIEDLIRVKRAERPPPEFWAEFERDMRIKQLAAIVEPRPWWASFIRVGARVAHYQLPVGAAAILVLSFVTIREYRVGYSPTLAPEIVRPQTAALPEVAVATTRPAIATPAPVAEQLPSSREETESAVSAVGEVSHTVPLFNTAATAPEPTPSARYIAANLAAAQAADPRIIDEVFGSPVRNLDSRERMRDPLTQVATPGEARRSRLLATALPVAAGASDVTVGNSDRVARRLTEERLYDSISRIGVKGDRVAIKF